MPAFEYLALDAAGRRKSGVVEADSDGHVRQIIRQNGLILLQIGEVAARRANGAGASFGLFAPRLRGAQLAVLTRSLAALVGSGLPIDDALQAASRQGESASLRRIVIAIRMRVLEGQSLAQAMSSMPNAFPDMYTATVSAGEQTPRLGLVLEKLADYIDEQQQMKQKLKMAMLYPAVLTLTAVLVIAGLLTYVVPEVVQIFDSMHRELPVLTRGLIAVADYARHWGWQTLAAVVLLGCLMRYVLARPGPRRAWDALLLRLPLTGFILREADAARFSRTLSVLLQSGVTMLEALRICAKALAALPMREAVADAANRVHEGVALHYALSRTQRFPAIMSHLIANGEASGNLEAMLETAARMHERNVQNALGTLLALLEPLLILTMGAIVCVIVVAMLLPIFDLNTLV